MADIDNISRGERRPYVLARGSRRGAALTGELSRARLAGMLAPYPALSLQTVAKIYTRTLRLKLKGARYFSHPQGREPRGFLSP